MPLALQKRLSNRLHKPRFQSHSNSMIYFFPPHSSHSICFMCFTLLFILKVTCLWFRHIDVQYIKWEEQKSKKNAQRETERETRPTSIPNTVNSLHYNKKLYLYEYNALLLIWLWIETRVFKKFYRFYIFHVSYLLKLYKPFSH